jgi:hypothetical protein
VFIAWGQLCGYRRASRTQKLHGAQRERRRTRGHSGRIVRAARGWGSARQGWIPAQAKRCAICARLRVGVGGPVGVAPRRVPGQWKAPRLSAVSAPFAWSGIPSGALVGSSASGIQAGEGGTTTNGVLGDPGVGLCTAACTLARGSLGPCVRRLDGCRSWLRSRTRAAHGGQALAVGSAANRGHRGACEVLGPDRCASESVLVAEVIERRSAQRSHRGCGRGGGRGPSHRRETDRGERRCQGETSETMSNLTGSRRAARWWKASRAVAAVSLHGWAVQAVQVARIGGAILPLRVATEASEPRPESHLGWRTGGRSGVRAGRSEARGVNRGPRGE